MTHFEQYLKYTGFAPFKMTGCKYDKRVLEPLSEKETGYFSTMVPGRISNIWVKDGKEVVFGLNEKGKPPTLCYPRPKGIRRDDEMNKLLKELEPEEIFKMIYE